MNIACFFSYVNFVFNFRRVLQTNNHKGQVASKGLSMQVARGYSLTKGDKAETRLQGLNGEQGGGQPKGGHSRREN